MITLFKGNYPCEFRIQAFLDCVEFQIYSVDPFSSSFQNIEGLKSTTSQALGCYQLKSAVYAVAFVTQTMGLCHSKPIVHDGEDRPKGRRLVVPIVCQEEDIRSFSTSSAAITPTRSTILAEKAKQVVRNRVRRAGMREIAHVEPEQVASQLF